MSTKHTRYIGVSFAYDRWSATFRRGALKKHLGDFATAEEAARAYDAEALRFYGPHANVNFPAAEKGVTSSPFLEE